MLTKSIIRNFLPFERITSALAYSFTHLGITFCLCLSHRDVGIISEYDTWQRKITLASLMTH